MRILIYRLGSLGDTVVALPCFRLLRSHYPAAEIVVLTNLPVSGKAAALQAVLENTGLADRYIPYPVGLRDPGKLAELRRRIAAEKFDLVVSLTAARGLAASVRDYLFFRSCGIRKIRGIPWRQRDLEPARTADGLHEAETTRLLRRAGWDAAAPEDGRDLALTPKELATAGQLLEERSIPTPFLAASLGTKSALNDWGDENWRLLLAQLAGDFPSHGLVLVGSADESTRSGELAAAWTGSHANLCGATSPRVTAALLARAAVFLGHDSGPMHLAAAAGAPVVAVFSARNPPGQWFPGGVNHRVLYPHRFYDPARREDTAHQRAALASISVDSVAQAARPWLATSVSTVQRA